MAQSLGRKIIHRRRWTALSQPCMLRYMSISSCRYSRVCFFLHVVCLHARAILIVRRIDCRFLCGVFRCSRSSFFGCSSHPLCKATRKGHKNGAVIELIAEKADSSDTSDTESRSASRKSTCTPEEDDKHDGCVARYGAQLPPRTL